MKACNESALQIGAKRLTNSCSVFECSDYGFESRVLYFTITGTGTEAERFQVKVVHYKFL